MPTSIWNDFPDLCSIEIYLEHKTDRIIGIVGIPSEGGRYVWRHSDNSEHYLDSAEEAREIIAG